MHDTVCHNGGLMSSTAVLANGARLGVDEVEIPRFQ
jgi:hypothetical protein